MMGASSTSSNPMRAVSQPGQLFCNLSYAGVIAAKLVGLGKSGISSALTTK